MNTIIQINKYDYFNNASVKEVLLTKKTNRMTLIIILAAIMTLSVVTLIVLKKYKTRRR